MDLELILFLGVTRNLPMVRGTGYVSSLLRDFYRRKPRDPVVAGVRGFKMELNPSEFIDSCLLFYPHRYDRHEIDYLDSVLKPGSVFIDVGSHIGFYSLAASRRAGPDGKVIAIEADPYNYRRLARNLELNSASNVIAVNAGVSDKRETLRLGLNTGGNRSGNSFLDLGYRDGVEVKCFPLLDVLKEHGVDRVDAAKLDIEGFEFRVLDRFFKDADPELYPKSIIVEHHPEWNEKAGGDVIELLKSRGYRVTWSSDLNFILTLP